jgi:hypothetical protein
MNKALKIQIDDMNFMAQLFNKSPRAIDADNLTDADAQKIFQKIDGGLSPENLHCDGEITAAAARAKYRAYMSAIKGLQTMGFVARDCYEF